MCSPHRILRLVDQAMVVGSLVQIPGLLDRREQIRLPSSGAWAEVLEGLLVMDAAGMVGLSGAVWD